ncbi:MAG: O-antigen/teichoic acid export membrane protein [Saprospiraceae bacterium]
MVSSLNRQSRPFTPLLSLLTPDSMNREFFINIVFLVSINLLIKPFFIFFIDRTVQNVVGAETYGLYFALLNLTYLLQIFNDFGINSFNNRNISRHSQLLEKYFPNILVLKCFLGLLFIVLAFGVAWLFGYAIHLHLLFFILLNQLFISFILFFRSNISGLAMYRTDSMLSALDKLLMILFCGILLWVSPFKEQFRIEYFVYGQTLALFLTALIAFATIYKNLNRIRFRFNPAFLKLILKESYPYALVFFLMMTYTRIDGVMIERLLPDGAYEAGVYASAFRLLDAGNQVGFLFAGLLLPMFSRMIKGNQVIKSLLRFSILMIWGGAITMATATCFYSTEIMDLLYVEATPYWGGILRYLMISFVAISGIHIFGTLLTANGSLKELNIIFSIGVILNIIFNYFLILNIKAEGAALATVVTQFFVLFAEIRLVMKTFNLKIDSTAVIRLLGFIAVLIPGAWLLENYSTIDWKYNFLINIMAGLGLAVLFKLIDIRGIKSLEWK